MASKITDLDGKRLVAKMLQDFDDKSQRSAQQSKLHSQTNASSQVNWTKLLFACFYAATAIIIVLWGSVCLSVESRVWDKKLSILERYNTTEDLLNPHTRNAFEEAQSVLTDSLLFNAALRMITDIPIMRRLGSYETVMAKAVESALQQHMFLGVMFSVVVVCVTWSIITFVKVVCDRQVWGVSKSPKIKKS